MNQYDRLKKAALFLCLFLFSITSAQSISGTVRDEQGEALNGAKVQVGSAAAFVKLDGTFEIKNIPPATYKVIATAAGYGTATQEVTVEANKESHLDITLSNSEKSLEGIHITSIKESDRKTQKLERNADQLMNVVSAKNIQLMPDITVANVMQRMSGVTVERSSSGEGRHPVIRGMDKRYNTTLVNGIKIPSPDSKNRFIPMDIFPSELLQRLEVIKSLIPEMEGDAIGGTMNMVMKDAPANRLLQINASEGLSTLFNSKNAFESFDTSVISRKSPLESGGTGYSAKPGDFPMQNIPAKNRTSPLSYTFGATFGNRYGKDKKFGFLFSGSFQNTYRGADTYFIKPNFQAAANNTPTFSDVFIRKNSTQSKRLGLNMKLDYKFNDKNKISLYNLYLHMDERQYRSTIDSIVSIQRQGPGSGNVQTEYRTTWQVQDIRNHTLKGEHDLADRLKLDWTGVYSYAKNEMPDQTNFSFLHAVGKDASGVQSSSADIVQPMNRLWRRNSDKDLGGYINLTFSPQVFGRKSELKIGGMYRDKTRDNYMNEYTLTPTNAPNSNSQLYTGVIGAVFYFKGQDGALGSASYPDPNLYTTHEIIGAGFLQAKINLTDKLEALGGVRVETTKDNFVTQAADNVIAKYGTLSYKDLLPSLQLKYMLTSGQSLRMAIYKAIARPSYFDMVPYLNSGEAYDEVGNPYIKRTKALNIDARYEWLFGSANQLLLGGFYKNIQDPIELALVQGTKISSVLKPVNLGTATNFGFEIVLTKYFGNFGFSGNYTFTNSKISTEKGFINSGNTLEKISQTRPLQGQAAHIGNLSLLYKDPRHDFDAQLSFVYTGEKIAQVSQYFELDTWQKPVEQLDFSIEKSINKNFSAYLKINNLTNSPYILFVKHSNPYMSGKGYLPFQVSEKEINVQKDVYKQSFLLGIRYKL